MTPVAPEVDLKLVERLVQEALDMAMAETIGTEQQPTRQDLRSRAFVRALGGRLAALYSTDATVRVLDRSNDGNREEFGLNELLYDVSVFRTEPVTSARRGKKLLYVAQPLWQVESELSDSSAETLRDFNKLVMGASLYKLFIGRHVANQVAFASVLRPAARCCTGRVFAAWIPHPELWGQAMRRIECEDLQAVEGGSRD